MSRRCTVREHLNDDHAAAAAWTGRFAGIGGGRGGLLFPFCNGEQLARTGDARSNPSKANLGQLDK